MPSWLVALLAAGALGLVFLGVKLTREGYEAKPVAMVAPVAAARAAPSAQSQRESDAALAALRALAEPSSAPPTQAVQPLEAETQPLRGGTWRAGRSAGGTCGGSCTCRCPGCRACGDGGAGRTPHERGGPGAAPRRHPQAHGARQAAQQEAAARVCSEEDQARCAVPQGRAPRRGAGRTRREGGSAREERCGLGSAHEPGQGAKGPRKRSTRRRKRRRSSPRRVETRAWTS